MSDSILNILDTVLANRVNELASQIEGKQNPNATVPPMPALLNAALKNEWETALLTSFWVTDETDSDFRILLARLAGDEARHFSMIEERLTQLGGSKNVDELNKRTPLFNYLIKQTTTLDRMITGPFAREALAVARNNVFLDHCKGIEDFETIKIYESIQADEAHHHKLGRLCLSKWLRGDQQLEYAKQKILEVLNVVDEIQEMAVMKRGVCKLPGC